MWFLSGVLMWVFEWGFGLVFLSGGFDGGQKFEWDGEKSTGSSKDPK
jgi:hypothetical protein